MFGHKIQITDGIPGPLTHDKYIEIQGRTMELVGNGRDNLEAVKGQAIMIDSSLINATPYLDGDTVKFHYPKGFIPCRPWGFPGCRYGAANYYEIIPVKETKTLQALTCNHCGAPLEKDLSCKYCGTRYR